MRSMATGGTPLIFDPALGVGLTELIDLIAQGELGAARERGNALLQRYPEQPELWRLTAICALQMGELEAAQQSLDRALELAPQSVESWCNLASVYTAGGRLSDAERALRRALAIAPQHAAALNNLGSLLDARGDYHAAAECFSKAIVQKPDYARAWLNQAAALLAIRQTERAESSARRAIQLAPHWADAQLVLGNVLAMAGRKPAALDAWREAARLEPRNPQLQHQHAMALEDHGDLAGAQRAYENALRVAADYWPALSQLVFLQRRLCNWHALAPLSRRLLDAIDHGAPGVTPFSMLVEESTPAQQLACAQTFARSSQMRIAPIEARLAPRPHARRNGPLRVGFLSAGFGEHPTALLIAELIERLRGTQLQTFGYATTPDDDGALRKRLSAAFHEFRDLSALPIEGMLRKLRDDQLDILLDVDGYCEGSRPELFALRPAPLQVNWLAYPGTLGAPWYDYVLADHSVIPPEQRAHYSEKIAYLPHCYQPSDTRRVVDEPPPRAQLGLPESVPVFACFNHSWKYTLRSFARWMRVLKGVPGSVLWLLAGPPGADDQLRKAAHAAGVDPARLVFAGRVAHAQHLARYRHAALFLDTNPYNAHTTASDALWAGCPVLTQPGATFASRVAGSLNLALGMDEFNAASDQAYVDMAISLGGNPHRLAAARERLDKARLGAPLFDMAGYARAFEAALLHMFRRFEHGQEAQDFEIPE